MNNGVLGNKEYMRVQGGSRVRNAMIDFVLLIVHSDLGSTEAAGTL